MAYEDVFETIEVITHFQRGKIIPLRFLWNGRAYPVKHIHSRWQERIGSTTQIHFSVRSETTDCFELIFDSADYSWQLARVFLD
ncbi:MAG: hypothetical protein ACRBF0_00880 [Calditrichia bacterium]